jgi:transposase InsO family protein
MKEMARHVGVVPRTMRRWRALWRRERLQTKPRGRPVAKAERSVRQSVLMVLAFLGPEVGLPTLEWIFPYVSRSVLTDLSRRYRKLARLEFRALLHILDWHRVGAVWAADFCTPPLPIDGLYNRVFNVRDLASGTQLMALPVFDETAATAIKALEVLIRWCGVPLVLKVDNGSGFIALETRDWATQHGIHLLYSPPQTPAYNGAIEAGTGSIETRAYHHAARHGRPWEWTCDDVESARRQANETGHPHGRNGPTPGEAWAGREPIQDNERAAFDAAYRRHEEIERRQRTVPEGVQLQRHEQASIDRVAVGRALIELGFLSIRRKRITPRIPKRKADRIS